MEFERFSKEDHTQALADFLFDGKLSLAKNIEDTNLRKLLIAFACEFQRIEDKIATVSEEHYIFETTLLIEEWESAVGIPDECFPIADTLEERRNNVVTKLCSDGIVTEEDFLRIAQLLGYDVTITPLIDLAYPPYCVPFIPVREEQAHFTMVVSGLDVVDNFPPYDVPFIPLGVQGVIQCIFDKLRPAMSKNLYANICTGL